MSSIEHIEERPAPTAADEVAPAIDRFEGRWWLVHTKPRNEKALAEELARRNIDCFLPLAYVKRRYGRRTIAVHIPLFPGYLFLNGGEDERYATLMTHRAVNVIDVANQTGLAAELRNIHRATTSGEPVDVYPGLHRGRRCRVVRGPFKGLEGVVLQRRDPCRVYIGVEILGQSVQVDIDAALLESID